MRAGEGQVLCACFDGRLLAHLGRRLARPAGSVDQVLVGRLTGGGRKGSSGRERGRVAKGGSGGRVDMCVCVCWAQAGAAWALA